MWANRATATFHCAGVFFRNVTDPAEMFLNISKAVSVCVHTVVMLSVICMKIIFQSSWWVHTQKQHILRKKIYRSVVWLDTDYFNSKHTGECVSCWFNSHLFTEILRTHASYIKCLGVLHDQWTIQVLREQWGPGETQRKLPSLSESTELLPREGIGDNCKRKPELTWH